MLHRTISRLSSKGSDDPKNASKLHNEFDVGETLGEGGFGQIVKAKRKSDKNDFAIKIIKFDSNSDDVDTIRGEANMLSKLNHNNIVRYYNSWVETVPLSEYEKFKFDSEEPLSSEIQKLWSSGSLKTETCADDYLYSDCDDDEDYNEAYEDEEDDDISISFEPENKEIKYLFIQMELCDKRTLRTTIDNNLHLEEAKVTKYFKEICKGLSFIHKNNIVHRDLKPENIFLTSDDVIKLGDFGLSKQISLDNEFEAMQTGELPYGSPSAACGTHIYMAPELSKRNKFNVKADIYSLGVIYFEMCSKPMTDMEKHRTFPITNQKWKDITFSNKKKNLIKSLLHTDHHERPTCERILKILNSEKSFDEMKDVINQNKRVPYQELKNFEKTLKAINVKKTEMTNFFLTTAAKIFERHGGQNIPMPTFVPSFSDHSDNLTTLLNTRGNSTSISNTSRIAFSNYVANKRIKKIRRYSVGKTFDEGFFAPSEVQECLFEVVSAELDDHVAEAEMLYIAEEICQKVLPKERNKIYFVMSHDLILSTILKYCKISEKEYFIASRISIYWTRFANITGIFALELKQEIREFLLKLVRPFTIPEIEKIEDSFKNNSETFGAIDTKLLKTALDKLKTVDLVAKKFGVKSDILVLPLLINEKHSTGFMFHVMEDHQSTIVQSTMLATGGRFESLINRCNRTTKRKPLKISAVELSFNVENVLKLLSPCFNSSTCVDVVIVSKDKTAAVPIYTELLTQEIKCEIVEGLVSSDESSQRPSKVIQLHDDIGNVCSVFSIKPTGIPWKLTRLFTGNWKDDKFLRIVGRSVPVSLPQITYRSV